MLGIYFPTTLPIGTLTLDCAADETVDPAHLAIPVDF
jgi:hypothetical protein